MGRTFSLLGLVVFTVGVVALSSLARRTKIDSPQHDSMDNPAIDPTPAPRRAIPVFAFNAPFSLN